MKKKIIAAIVLLMIIALLGIDLVQISRPVETPQPAVSPDATEPEASQDNAGNIQTPEAAGTTGNSTQR